MSALAQLQQDFHAYVIAGDKAVAEQVVGTAAAGREERLGIYASAYRLRLLEVLQTDFPGLHTLLGDQAFEALTLAYIEAYPSIHPSLRWFGQHLTVFLQRHPPYAQQAVLAEMAAFEWQQSSVFDAPDAQPMGLDAMAAIDPDTWPEMRLILHPSVRRLDLEWNVPTFWRATEQEGVAEPPALEQAAHPLGWVLWRQALNIHWRSLEVDEAWALDRCLEGYTFGDICEGLCEWIDQQHAPMHAAGLLKRWITDGMLDRIAFD